MAYVGKGFLWFCFAIVVVVHYFDHTEPTTVLNPSQLLNKYLLYRGISERMG